MLTCQEIAARDIVGAGVDEGAELGPLRSPACEAYIFREEISCLLL